MPRDPGEIRMRILAILRHLVGAEPQEYAVSSATGNPTRDGRAVDPAENGALADGQDDGFPREGRWWPDYLSFRPLYDRGGPISVTPSADGPIGTLARIELNIREGKDPGDGLPPDPLNDPESP
jgi:hypothetical protein